MDLYDARGTGSTSDSGKSWGLEAGTLMASLPPAGSTELATKTDLRRFKEELELKIDATKQELRAEMHPMGRSLMVFMTTVTAILLGILFAALRLS